MALGDLHPDSRPARRTDCTLLLAKGTMNLLFLLYTTAHIYDLCNSTSAIILHLSKPRNQKMTVCTRRWMCPRLM